MEAAGHEEEWDNRSSNRHEAVVKLAPGEQVDAIQRFFRVTASPPPSM